MTRSYNAKSKQKEKYDYEFETFVHLVSNLFPNDTITF